MRSNHASVLTKAPEHYLIDERAALKPETQTQLVTTLVHLCHSVN
jgi:hypothetical protein